LVPLQETISPRAALLWRVLPSSSLRLSAGTAFRSPNFMESYLDFDQYTGVDAIYIRSSGDSALLPERIQSLELAITAWNLLALLDGGSFQEHPKGQWLDGRLLGSLTYSL